MIVLGIGSPFGHDSAAAVLIDGKVIAAVEEERFSRVKHAPGLGPIEAVRFCLKQAALRPEDIQHIAYPCRFEAYDENRWPFIQRTWRYQPSRAFKAFYKTATAKKKQTASLHRWLRTSGIDPSKVTIHFVEHHIAHAASAFYFSGAKQAAILSMDAAGEVAATLFAEAKNGKITKIKEFYVPDSLGLFYGTMTDYLGFQHNDGEYKLMGMAPYGDPRRFDFSDLVHFDARQYRVNLQYIWASRHRRHDPGKWFSRKMVERLGPPRDGDDLLEPYVHIAAATQKTLEDVTLALVETYLSEPLERSEGHLCFAGGCALNVSLNRRLIEHPRVKQLFVQPAADDSGTPLGAAAFVAAQEGDAIEPMRHVYLGPEYTSQEIKTQLEASGTSYTCHEAIEEVAAELLAKGEVVAWFQGAMEFGPRALGNRSILANPAKKGIADTVNEMIKYRERWRPFCPSILPEHAADILGSMHPSPFMTFSFAVNPSWKERIPEVVHVDGTTRPQIVDPETNARYYRLLKIFHQKTGLPVLLNTSLNRRGEPMICSPKDALEMFYGSGLRYLVMDNFLVTK
ncbi:MAG: carbamoyltransferase C-terminal domain-containing protein [Candidatus Omnitrophota bacterium]